MYDRKKYPAWVKKWARLLDRSVYSTLWINGPMTALALCNHINQPQTTVYDALTRLKLKGWVTQEKEAPGIPRRGRPKMKWSALDPIDIVENGFIMEDPKT